MTGNIDNIKSLGSDNSNKRKREIIKESGDDILRCYNCGTCASSCPVAAISDFNPRKIINKIILGLDVDEDIWVCVSCFTCNARCPNGIDIANVIDTLRIKAVREKKFENHPQVIFNRAFLETVEKYGTLYELEMLAKYKIKSRNFFNDIELGLPLMLKGKISLLPRRSRNADAAKEIFKKVREIEERQFKVILN